MSATREELLIAAIADLIAAPHPHPVRHAAVGAASPIPAHAVMLARHRGLDVRLSLLQQRVGNPFTEGARELFDLAGQGRIDLFFLGGVQIDGQANINLVGTGRPAGSSARLPGNFGSAFMAFTVPRIILFREEHSPRVLVPKVDYVSAPGVSPPGVCRRGSPQALVTGRCVFTFDAARGRFVLASLHPGETFRHGFTHFTLSIRPWVAQVADGSRGVTEPSTEWFELQDALAAGLPKPVRTLLSGIAAEDLLTDPR